MKYLYEAANNCDTSFKTVNGKESYAGMKDLYHHASEENSFKTVNGKESYAG